MGFPLLPVFAPAALPGFTGGFRLPGLAALRRLIRLTVSVASGTPSKAEALGHREFFIPYKYQEKQVVFPRPCD